MLFPTHAMSYALDLTTPLDFPESFHDFCHDPPSILHAMTVSPAHDISPAHLSLDHSAKFLSKFHEACLPPPTTVTYRQPIHLCAWKIESPSRVLVYTGKHPVVGEQQELLVTDPASFTPHTLSKLLLDERSKRPTPSSIHLLSNDQEFTQEAIRQSLLHFAQTALTPHRERISVLQKRQGGSSTTSSGRQVHLLRRGANNNATITITNSSMVQQPLTVLDHTLEEAAAVFTHPPTRNHSEIGLNQSPPWDKDHVDSRCTNIIDQLVHPPSLISRIMYIYIYV